MRLSLSAWVGLRYHGSKQKQRFLSLLSWVSLLGMVLGIAALIIVLSVMNGFQSEIKGRLLAVIPHGIITSTSEMPIKDWESKEQHLLKTKGITAIAPWVGGDAMFTADDGMVAGNLNGIDSDKERGISALSTQLTRGSLTRFNDNRFSIILGSGVAAAIGANLGEKVQVTIPRMMVTPFGLKPRMKQFEVVGIFEVGADVDSTDAFIRLQDAQALYGYRQSNQIDAFRFKANDIFRVRSETQLMNRSPLFQSLSLTATPWTAMREQLFSAIKMEKIMVMLMLSLVIAVAAFNLISMMTMMVSSKRSEIAVLRMMGISRYSVLLIFLVQGLSLAFISVLLGGVIGVLVALNLGDIVNFLEQLFGFYIFDPTVFYISGLPSELQVNDVLYVIGLTLFLAVLFVSYPAYRATRIKAVEALQYQ